MEVQHEEIRCANKECRVGYRHGYHINNESVIYDSDALSKEILIVSRRTGFEVLYLYEAVMSAFHGNVSFSAICEIYNSVHCSLISKDIDRFTLYYKRLSRAFFTYALLDISRRYELRIQFHEDNIDHTISSNFDKLQMLIQEKWGNHQCDVKGCGEVLVMDGGLKPKRKVCAARTAAVYAFKHADIRTVVGCKTYPTPGQKFCREHLSSEVPNVPSVQMSRKNVRALRSTRKSVKTEKVEEDVFTIEAIQKKKVTKKGSMFLVKWLGYDKTTWEPMKNIPRFIIDFFEKNGSALIPRPRIKSTKKVGNGKYFLLTWEQSSEPDTYVPESDFVISPAEEETLASCNTRKHHGARFCNTSAGIFVGAFPCGTIPLFEEIHGVESISQCYGIVTDFIGETKPKKLKYILYDDGCHFAPFAKKPHKSLSQHGCNHCW